jgi:hypothetical protein
MVIEDNRGLFLFLTIFLVVLNITLITSVVFLVLAIIDLVAIDSPEK